MTEGDRLCDPVPHDLVHGVYAPKPDTKQCDGHGPCVQAVTFTSSGHAWPPALALIMMVRDLDWTPLPHDFEQADNAPNSLTWQSTGQTRVLHALDSCA